MIYIINKLTMTAKNSPWEILNIRNIGKKTIYIPMLIAALSFSSCNNYESADDAKSKNLSTINDKIEKREKEIKELQEEVRDLKKDKADRERR